MASGGTTMMRSLVRYATSHFSMTSALYGHAQALLCMLAQTTAFV